jgi:glycosyltransferase involved in cell wall biosynthesis
VHPRFSVVIPVRDRADVVGRAVASVLAQTFADLEVVVVDDGSTDHSVDAVRAVADRRVRLVRQERQGLDAARAVGLRRSRGRHVSVLEPDDEAAPGWLARVGRLIDSTDAALVGCGGEQRHADGSRTVVARSLRPGAFVVRRGLLKDMDLQRPLASLGEDLLAAATERELGVVTTPEPLVRWNEQDEAETRSSASALRLRWALQSLDALARTPIPDGEQLLRSATVGAIAAVHLGDHAEARRLFRLARGVAPDQLKVWARWAIGCVPPLSTRIFDGAGQPVR